MSEDPADEVGMANMTYAIEMAVAKLQKVLAQAAPGAEIKILVDRICI
jgi:hypothetical protein